MSIEFLCSACGKLLRTGDDAAGKKARCPSCGAVQGVPFQPAPTIETYPVAEPVQRPLAAQPGKRAGMPRPDPTNAYAAPLSYMSDDAADEANEYRGPRNGPPWERDGASLASFWATTKLAYSAPKSLFLNLRREGCLLPPLLYALAGGLTGGLIAVCCSAGLQLLNLLAGRPQAHLRGAPLSPAGVVVVGAVAVIAVLAAAVAVPFILSGIFHLCLTLLGGARHPYETTLRVVCYAFGSAALLEVIPFCGPYLGALLAAILSGIGLAYAHETTGQKAALAVLIPFLVRCGALNALSLIAIVLAIAAGR
ncbi:MAG TPA: YIP1 family protein [Pirellulales bacterium]|nr:YIP1 family protein [Pirellulales bacterium]